MHERGACALTIVGVSKDLSGLACMQADPNLAKITTSHFQVPKCKPKHAKLDSHCISQ